MSHLPKAALPAIALLVLAAAPLQAAEPDPDGDQTPASTERIETLERKLRILTEEVQSLRRHQGTAAPPGGTFAPKEAGRAFGFGRSASRVYQQAESGVSWAGYGEAHLRLSSEPPEADPAGGNRSGFFRQALYLGYRYSDRFLLNSEMEIEHGSKFAVEFAYLDFLYSDHARFRAGLLLAPLGFINQQHEPADYFGSDRPLLADVLIPTSMRENGLGAYGTVGDQWQYYLYVTNSLDGTGLRPGTLAEASQSGFSGDDGARTEDYAVTGRFDWAPLVGARLGVSVWHGDTGQRQDFAGSEPAVPLTLADVHAQWHRGPWRLRGVYAEARIGDTRAVNQYLQQQDTDLPAEDQILGDKVGAVPERMTGWYLEAGYDVLAAWEGAGPQSLYPWVRYSRVDSQAELAEAVKDDGYRADPALDRRVLSLGLHYMPHPRLVFKGDFRDWASDASGPGTYNHQEIRLGFGYRF